MDSEISKIWEEALRYVAPLPVSGVNTATKPSSNISTFPENKLHRADIGSTSSQRNDVSPTSGQRRADINVCWAGPAESSYNKDKHGSVSDVIQTCMEANSVSDPSYTGDKSCCVKSYPDSWTTEHSVDGVSSTSIKADIIETLYVSGDNENTSAINNLDPSIDHESCDSQSAKTCSTDVSTTSLEPTHPLFKGEMSLEWLHKSLAEYRNSNSPISTTTPTPLNIKGLNNDSKQDISSELAAGLRLIQQGNELISKALKLSNTKTSGVRSPLNYASLEPISMPSSVESVNIPSDISVEEEDPAKCSSEKSSTPLLNNPERLLVDEHSASLDIENPNRDGDTSEPKVKRRRRREKNPDPTPSVPVLPPCRICDEKSSGFHYGANTCEACKGFFRRTLKKNEISFPCKCTESEILAWKQGPYKNGCPSCRYERCLKVGMSKSAIKIGRYTLNRKTENIREVKSLEAIDSVIEKAIYSTIFEESPSRLDSATGSSDAVTSSVLSPLIDSQACSSTSIESLESGTSERKQSRLSVKEIEAIVAELTEAHQTSLNVNEELLKRPKEVVREIHRKYLEDYKLREALFGHMQPLSKKEFKDFYNATGIDIDGRLASMGEALKYLTKKVVKFVEYAKTIPGFRDLSLQDQASLIKHSRPEHMVLASYRVVLQNFSPDLQVITTPWGKEVHVKETNKIIPREGLKARMKFVRQLKDMEFSLEEEAIIRAIVITFSDRCELENPEAVEEIQLKLVACLEHLFGTRENKLTNPMYKLFNILTDFREYSEGVFKLTKELVIDWPMIADNELIREFLL